MVLYRKDSNGEIQVVHPKYLYGRYIEDLFFKIMQRMRDEKKFPPWLSFFCKATEAEDANGIDAWAYTDVGKLPLQIKSRDKDRQKHMSRENRKHIPCIVIPPGVTYDSILASVLQLLEAEREKHLKNTGD